MVLVTHVATRGRNGFDQWVESFQLQTSSNAHTEVFQFLRHNNGDVMTFSANSDRDTTVLASLPADTCARSIRLFPVAYRAWKSMRWEVYGCSVGEE